VGSELGALGFRNRGVIKVKAMKKSTKITLAIFIILIIAAVPLYYLTRPPANTNLQIKGKVNTPLNLEVNQLEKLQNSTIQVKLTSSSRIQDNGVFNYTGIPLQTLLAQAGIQDDATSIYIQASDGYGTTLTTQEANNPNTIVAFQKDGAPLTLLKNDGEGPLRLIIGSDTYAQRWVRGATTITVK
jgi:DMSO/TMAO reductase YedYZ molybdopterin-dependent catalytic subunit